MQIPPFVEKYKALLSIAGVILVVVAIFGYTAFKVFGPLPDSAVSSSSLLPKSFTATSDLINKEQISLKDKSFMESYFVKNAKDYTTYVPASESRGRDNPFVPYDSPGSSR
jgi:hypothetical protein